MKITESKLRKIVCHELKKVYGKPQFINESETFTDEQYRELSDIIRNEIAELFYTFFRKRNFWVND